MRLEELADPGQHRAQLVGGRLAVQPDRLVKPDAIADGEVFQAHVGQVSVGNRHHRAIRGPNPRRTQADIFDDAGELPNPALIPDVHRLVGNHHDPAKQVLDRFLRAKPDRQAADPQPGQHRGEIDAAQVQENQKGDDDRRRFRHAIEQTHQRRVPRPVESLRAPQRHRRDHVHQHEREPAQRDHRQSPGDVNPQAAGAETDGHERHAVGKQREHLQPQRAHDGLQVVVVGLSPDTAQQ